MAAAEGTTASAATAGKIVTQYKTMRLERDPSTGVAELIFCRPEKLNAMNSDFWVEVGKAMDEADEAKDVNVVVMWAEGRLFTAGLDLKETGMLSGSDVGTFLIELG